MDNNLQGFGRPEINASLSEIRSLLLSADWRQEGIVNHQAAQLAQEAGIAVVMNKCIYKEHVSMT